MITDKQLRFLRRLARFLDEHPEHDFQMVNDSGKQPRLSIRFPRRSRIKATIDKDHRNFDYKVDALFNRKLTDAVETVLLFDALFPAATRAMISQLCSTAADHQTIEFGQ